MKSIHAIVKEDTGGPGIHFAYIHGEGVETWIADSHKGQALGSLSLYICLYHLLNSMLGLGMFCQWLCRDLQHSVYLRNGSQRWLCTLDAYDHLKHFFRLCLVHFKRNVNELRHRISPETRVAMLNLPSVDKDEDLEQIFSIIRAGGEKASGSSCVLIIIIKSPSEMISQRGSKIK